MNADIESLSREVDALRRLVEATQHVVKPQAVPGSLTDAIIAWRDADDLYTVNGNCPSVAKAYAKARALRELALERAL